MCIRDRCAGQDDWHISWQWCGQVEGRTNLNLQQNLGHVGRQCDWQTGLHVGCNSCIDGACSMEETCWDTQQCAGHDESHISWQWLGQVEGRTNLNLQQTLGHLGRQCVWQTGLHVGCIGAAAGVSCCEQQWLGHRGSHVVLQWLGQRDTENEETLQQCIGHSSWQLVWHSEGHIGRVDTVGGLQQWSGHAVPQLKLQWLGQPTAAWDSALLQQWSGQVEGQVVTLVHSVGQLGVSDGLCTAALGNRKNIKTSEVQSRDQPSKVHALLLLQKEFWRFKPLSPKSDQGQFSPQKINT